MANTTENDGCCEDCRTAHQKCLDWASGNPERGVTCLHIFEHCKEHCGDC